MTSVDTTWSISLGSADGPQRDRATESSIRTSASSGHALIALTPLVVIWTGMGFIAEVTITFLLAVWTIIINTTEGPGTPRARWLTTQPWAKATEALGIN